MLMNPTLQYQQRTQTACRGQVYNIANMRNVDGQIMTLALVKLADGTLVTAHIHAEGRLRLGDTVELIGQSRGGLAEAYHLSRSA